MTSKVVRKRLAEAERKRQLIRHKRRLLIIGAVVALGALLFEHVLAGQLKGISNSIVTAQSRMSSGQAQEMLSLSKLRLSQAERQLSKELADRETEPAISKYNLQKELIELDEMYAGAAEDFERTSALLDTVAKYGAGAREMREWRGRIKIDLDALQPEVRKTAKMNNVPNPTWQNHASILIQTVKALTVRLEIALWGDSVITAAKKRKEAADRIYPYCSWAGWILLAAGVLIGLRGQLLGLAGDKE